MIIKDIKVEQAVFQDSLFKNVVLRNATVKDACLKESKFIEVAVQESSFENVNMHKSMAYSLSFNESSLIKVDFSNTFLYEFEIRNPVKGSTTAQVEVDSLNEIFTKYKANYDADCQRNLSDCVRNNNDDECYCPRYSLKDMCREARRRMILTYIILIDKAFPLWEDIKKDEFALVLNTPLVRKYPRSSVLKHTDAWSFLETQRTTLQNNFLGQELNFDHSVLIKGAFRGFPSVLKDSSFDGSRFFGFQVSNVHFDECKFAKTMKSEATAFDLVHFRKDATTHMDKLKSLGVKVNNEISDTFKDVWSNYSQPEKIDKAAKEESHKFVKGMLNVGTNWILKAFVAAIV